MTITVARLGIGSRLSALAALFMLALREHLRGKRLLVLSALYLLPVGLAVYARQMNERSAQLEFVFVLNMIPHLMVPLAALLYSSGMIQDEIEEQTLTYLLIRAFSKRSLYITKLLAACLTCIVLTAVFTTITCVVVYWGAPDLWSAIIPARCGKIVPAMAVSLVAYCSLFGCLSLFVRRSLVAGVAYIIILEGVVANFDFAARRLTVIYYFRVLVARWLELPEHFLNEWSLHLDQDPTAQSCVLVLLGASAAAVVASAEIFTRREFRLKTPEGT